MQKLKDGGARTVQKHGRNSEGLREGGDLVPVAAPRTMSWRCTGGRNLELVAEPRAADVTEQCHGDAHSQDLLAKR